ncbi:OPT oligopeptide transporter protein-domain-containing protein [Lipomyces oligophaga]|uniref:OPT oligopeptide transporter protein-domain-containing protein n=1 Tax=Lipomyces oligophaga TaxID=45792 RepID=UPI0034CFE954
MASNNIYSTSQENVDRFSKSSILDEKKDATIVTSAPVNRIDDDGFIIERIKHSDDLEDIFIEDAEFIISKLKTMEVAEALEVLRESTIYFKGDMNFPPKTMEKLHLMLEGPDAYGQGEELYDLDIRLEAALIKFHSPYPEVRSVCSPVDDPTMNCETFRVYLIAGLWTAFASFVNTMIYWRQPHFTLTSQVIQLMILPTGQTFAKIVPNWKVGFGKYKFELSPGPWTFKEQMLATIMANAGVSVAIVLYYIPTMRLELFYGNTWMTYGFTVVFSMSCQFFGFSVAGILRRWVIYPVKAVWPTVLPTLQLNKTLLLPERRGNIHGWTVSKYKFFNIVLGCSFVYFFLPDYLFTALSTFNWLTWIAPNNMNLAVVTGSKLGLGFNPITSFDWSVINYFYPLIVPAYTVANRYVGIFLGGIIILIMTYTNYLNSGHLPPNTASLYDRYGNTYNTSAVLTDNLFDVDKYRAYSPPFISAGTIVLYGADYTLVTFSFCYIILSEWGIVKEAVVGFYKSLKDRNLSNYDRYKDPISIMMTKYPEVPDWWFICMLFFSFGMGIIAIKCWPTGVPVWVFFAVMFITIALIIPAMIMYASTGYLFSVYLLATLLGGYWVPGSGIACIFMRSFGVGMDDQAETYVGDQKMAHYAKIPPRAVFRAQIVATFAQVFVSAGAWEMLVKGMPDLCTYTQPSKFVCTFAHTMYSQSIMFGIVGPNRTFDTLYPLLKWAFLIGAAISVPCWLLRKYFPRYLHFWQPVLIISGMTRWGATYNLSYYTPGLIASLAFMWYIKTRYTLWWAKYNYILSSGLTAGTAFSGILIFLALQYHPKTLTWWGNSVTSAGVDGVGTSHLLSVPDIGYYGPKNGTWF